MVGRYQARGVPAMGGAINKLTDLVVKNAKAGKSPRRISDGGGLFLEIRPNGSKYWRLAYRFNKRQKLLALGVYPQVSMQEARERARMAWDHLAARRDPSPPSEQRQGCLHKRKFVSDGCCRMAGEV